MVLPLGGNINSGFRTWDAGSGRPVRCQYLPCIFTHCVFITARPVYQTPSTCLIYSLALSIRGVLYAPFQQTLIGAFFLLIGCLLIELGQGRAQKELLFCQFCQSHECFSATTFYSSGLQLYSASPSGRISFFFSYFFPLFLFSPPV